MNILNYNYLFKSLRKESKKNNFINAIPNEKFKKFKNFNFKSINL